MKYFTLQELTASATATRKGIDNTPSPEVTARLTALVANVLDPLREAWGKPIVVTSGYRSPRLNRAVGGAARSQHCKGEAADIRTLSNRRWENRQLYDLIRKLGLPYDQLIDEYDYTWVHVSYKEGANRHEVLHQR
jgi:uncharacterized protein YcbK (DUF882 family)